MNLPKPSPEDIDAHLAAGCPEGDSCMLARARAVETRPEPPTRAEMAELMIAVHCAEEMARELLETNDVQAVMLASILHRSESGEILLTDAEMLKQRHATVHLSNDDGGCLLKLDPATRGPDSHGIH